MRRSALKRSSWKKVDHVQLRRRRGALKVKCESAAERKWKLAVRERDDYTCRWPDCGYYSLSIHAHHVHSRRQRPDLVLDVTNGAALCPLHHDGIHHTVEGRQRGRELGLLGSTTYEAAMKEKTAGLAPS